MAIIYGKDTEQNLTAADVRDAVIQCFTMAHKEVLEKKMVDLMKDLPPEEFSQLKKLNVEQMVRGLFKKVGGDFDQPTKENILAVCDELKVFASNFRCADVVEDHYKEIMKLVEKID